ncbi:MAG: hypothetical protein DSO07_06790 [Thermoproteota archaeon]|uniref:Uncharacterized protein n=2 Tax=Candidatus Methanodesulfokora washburnensis TaxID=2478471 RepID=A0A3R9PGF7_9CREN|nr:hypothetical protein D6D85_09485 [Candidatus Methanodesulfokores washburnensis]TDA41019.1 MAG: hypothetical protein DSO07_06790 [Candidatus Korarchaeota archaeon]
MCQMNYGRGIPMCDIYVAKCFFSTFGECDFEIPFHLGDFNTERFEIAVVCPKHNTDYIRTMMPMWYEIEFLEPTPQEEEYWKKRDKSLYEELMEWKKYAGQRILILCFTGNAGRNAEINHPNLISPFKIARVKGLPESLVNERIR